MDDRHLRVGIVGAGFSGLGVAIALRQRGIRDFAVFERAGDIGGTWRDNTYPGCQCDVPSHLYSYSFALNPDWSRTYSTQPEIWAYLQRCARRFGVLPHVRLEHEVRSAGWDEHAQRWTIETSRGTWTADTLVLANGALAEPALPEIPGRDRFEGHSFHSATWDRSTDLRGVRVGVIGTGASAIQIVPKIQPHVEHLTLFQRTPAWVLPHTDRPISDLERSLYRRFPPLQRLVRAWIYGSRELLVLGLAKDPRLIAPVRWLAQQHLERQVRDPALRERLRPRFSPGCKRLLLSDDFYPALTRSNVELVTSGIEAIHESAIVSTDGRAHPVDAVIYATGFHVTDNPVVQLIHGRDGRSLAQTWEDEGMRAYLGTTISGFPNLFMMTGPNTGQGHTSLLVMVEAQIRYLLDALRFMEARGVGTVEVRPEVMDAYNEDLQAKLRTTVWNAGGCMSWYLDREGRTPTIWPDFTWRFRRMTKRFDPQRYRVTRRGATREPVPA